MPIDILPKLSEITDFQILNIPLHWNHDPNSPKKGTFEFAGNPCAMFWTATSLAYFLEAIYRIAGPERYGLIMQAQGRRGEQEDWDFISLFPTFFEGMRGINSVAMTSGWGLVELIDYDAEKKTTRIRLYNGWEAMAQKTLGVCWGTHYAAGKLAGWISRHFKVNCWSTQQRFLARGDEYDEFLVTPSSMTVEEELLRIDREEKERQAIANNKEQQRELEVLVAQRTSDLRSTIEQLETASRTMREQSVLIQQLSSPIVQLWDGILLVTLVAQLDGARAQQLTETLLQEVTRRRARIVILDITGVQSLDKSAANNLVRTVQAVKLLGSETMLVGISPQIAQTLVSIDVDLSRITTAADLQRGLQVAMDKIGLAVQPKI